MKDLPSCELTFKPASHLWVVTPTYVTELLARLKRTLSTLAPPSAQIFAPSPAH